MEENTKKVRDTIYSLIIHSSKSLLYTRLLQILVGKWKYRNTACWAINAITKACIKVNEAPRIAGGVGRERGSVSNCLGGKSREVQAVRTAWAGMKDHGHSGR